MEQFAAARTDADGLHFTRHSDGFVSLCAIDKHSGRHYLPDTASRVVRQGTVMVATIVQSPSACVETTAAPHVAYVEIPQGGAWLANRLFYEPVHDPGNIPGMRMNGATLTGTVALTSGGTVVVVSQPVPPLVGELTLKGKLFTPEKPATAVGGFAYLTPDGLLMIEGLNANAPSPP